MLDSDGYNADQTAKGKPLLLVILVSWGIAFFEYWLAVPANRWGYGQFSAAQLKVIQSTVPPNLELTVITAAVVGVIVNLAVFFAGHVLWPAGLDGRFDIGSALIGIAAAVARRSFTGRAR